MLYDLPTLWRKTLATGLAGALILIGISVHHFYTPISISLSKIKLRILGALRVKPPSKPTRHYRSNALLDNMSDTDIVEAFERGTVIFDLTHCRVVKLSDDLIIKGGSSIYPHEAEAMNLATSLGIATPKVYRAIHRRNHDKYESESDSWFIVEDFIHGDTLENLWPTLDANSKLPIVQQIADIISTLQSTHFELEDVQPGPVGGSSVPWEGTWFSIYGAGPNALLPGAIFDGTWQGMEAWFNRKLEISQSFNRAPAESPRFSFTKCVLSHQDINLRNIIIDTNRKAWLIDWDQSGIYPPGFEQGCLKYQGCGAVDGEFRDLLLEVLPLAHRAEDEVVRLSNAGYGVSIGINIW